jgi:hypothetical protein
LRFNLLLNSKQKFHSSATTPSALSSTPVPLTGYVMQIFQFRPRALLWALVEAPILGLLALRNSLDSLV